MAARRASPVLLCVLAVALAAGGAATLVASSAPPFHPGQTKGLSYELPDTVLGLLLLAPLFFGFGLLIYRRVRRGGVQLPMTFLVPALVILLFLTLFVYFGHFTNPGAAGGSVATGPPSTNQTNGTHPGGGGGSGGSPTLLTPGAYGLPHWAPYVILAVVVLAIAGLAVPALWASVGRPRGDVAAFPDPATARSNAQAALAGAASALEGGADPRSVIEGLYARLLDRISVVSGDLSGRTPEEIRADCLVPLGVRPAAATALTRLFEEARYSSHPMGPESAARVRGAIEAASADLARSSAG